MAQPFRDTDAVPARVEKRAYQLVATAFHETRPHILQAKVEEGKARADDLELTLSAAKVQIKQERQRSAALQEELVAAKLALDKARETLRAYENFGPRPPVSHTRNR